MNKIKWPWVVLALFVIMLIVPYVFNFYKFPWSKSPGDWGTIGDYFGGLLNPLVSSLALYFLIKAYLTQKEELVETRQVLEKTEESNKEVAKSQKLLVETQHLTSLINSEYQKVEYLYKELDRCTTAIVNGRSSIDRFGNEWSSIEAGYKYRKSLINDIAEITKIIELLDEKLSKVNT
ncbi:hypothetical protein [Aeromonas caviae]|uniref:hypothetical protein n=1 Tax=Aeromonas caviae TaxID=648 RepID=UPI0029D60D58|nr:hypothetical protein [Aeromonas caviae]MDX7787021.1 hypothetical protein [Aeromonas caviae]